jgi:hypothetical protein
MWWTARPWPKPVIPTPVRRRKVLGLENDGVWVLI